MAYFTCDLYRLVNIDDQDENGWTSLHYASWGGYSKCINVLLQNGADRGIHDNKKRKAIDIARYREYYGMFINLYMTVMSA